MQHAFASTALRRGLIACSFGLLLAACSEEGGGGGGGSGGSGGRGGSGGASGRGGNGTGGTGGTTSTGGTGGSTGGSGGSTGGAGGTTSTGGSGGTTGGSGGSGGTGGSTGGTGGGGGMTDARPETGGDATRDTRMGDGGAADLPAGPVVDPTVGFRQVMPMWNIQSPRNVPRGERYKYDAATGVHTMINYSTDEAFQAGNNTDPRTEFRWTNEYSRGQHMFDADLFLVPGSNRTCIMQVFGASSSATTLMLTAWADGSIRRYFGENPPNNMVIPNAAGRWLNLKVLHDVDAGMIRIYEDNRLVNEIADRGGSSHHFKNGVYGTTMRSETRWKNIKYWVK